MIKNFFCHLSPDRRARALGLALTLAFLPNLLPVAPALAKKKVKNSENIEAEKPKEPDNPGCPACLSTGSSLFAKGKNLEAAEYLRGWLEKCPNNLQLRLILHTVLMRLPKSKDEALAVAKQAIAIAPDSMLAHLQAAMTMLTMGNTTGAATEFEKVVAIDPTNYDAWLSLSDLYAGLNEGTKAQEAAAKAVSLSPSNKQARVSTLLTMSRAGNVSGVHNQFKQLLNSADVPIEGYIDIGDQALNLGFYQEASQFFNRFCEQFPKSSTARYKQLLAMYLNGDNQACLDGLIEDANNLRVSDSTSALLALEAMCNVTGGQLGKARDLVNTANMIDGKQALVPFAQGYLAYKDGNYRDARGALTSSGNKEKSLFPAKLLVAKIILKNGDALESAAAAHELRKIPGVESQALALELQAALREEELNKSSLANLKTEVGRALAALSESNSEKTKRAALNLALLRYALFENNIGEAKTFLSKAVAANRDEDIILAEADIALAEGNQQAAQDALEQALLIAPGDIEVLSQLGIILSKAGQSRGETLLLKAAGEGTLNAQASFALAGLMEKKGKTTEAEKLFRHSLENGLTGPDKLIARDALAKITKNSSAAKPAALLKKLPAH